MINWNIQQDNARAPFFMNNMAVAESNKLYTCS